MNNRVAMLPEFSPLTPNGSDNVDEPSSTGGGGCENSSMLQEATLGDSPFGAEATAKQVPPSYSRLGLGDCAELCRIVVHGHLVTATKPILDALNKIRTESRGRVELATSKVEF